MVRSLTHERLRALLDYDWANGEFIWRVDGRGRFQRKGNTAGSFNKGRRYITISQRRYLASRLAFFWMRGRWPKGLIDHKNRIRRDDRWSNLREASHSQNNANRTGKSFKGAYRMGTNRRYAARIKINRQAVHLGYFDTAEEAHAVYCIAAKKYFGKFARFD